MNKDDDIFKGKTLSDLAKDIYDNSKKKDRQINLLISELRPLIKNSGDATVIVPLIKEYLEVSVKNDDHMVKLATIFQRLISTSQRVTDGSGTGLLTEEEKQELLDQLDDITDTQEDSTSDLTKERIQEKMDEVKQRLDISDETDEDIDASD